MNKRCLCCVWICSLIIVWLSWWRSAVSLMCVNVNQAVRTVIMVLFVRLCSGMAQRLQLDSQSDDMDFIGSIAQKMFSDGSTNWGRITSLVAFGAVLCVRLKELQKENCVERVAEHISSFLISEQQDWLQRNKGWVSWVQCASRLFDWKENLSHTHTSENSLFPLLHNSARTRVKCWVHVNLMLFSVYFRWVYKVMMSNLCFSVSTAWVCGVFPNGGHGVGRSECFNGFCRSGGYRRRSRAPHSVILNRALMWWFCIFKRPLETGTVSEGREM